MLFRSPLRIALLCVPLMWPSSWAAAADATAQLQQFVDEVNAATGEFAQQQLDDEGQPADQAQSGTFVFERPGRFRWEVIKPYEQLTLSDGKQLYQYDPDLAQVIERDVDESVGASPAAILFGSDKLSDAFELSSRPDKDGMSWLRAEPRSGDAGFAHVDIGFADNMPQQLLLQDAFGQITHIELTDMDTNPSPDPQAFKLDVPEDTDIVRM